MIRPAAAVLLAASLTAAARAEALPHALALELWINGMCTHQTLRVAETPDGLVIARDDLTAQGVALPGDTKEVALSETTPIRATMDASNQRLLLVVPAKDLAPQHFDLHPSGEVHPDPMPVGAILNYDLAAEAGDVSAPDRTGSLGFNGWTSLFTPWGILRASGFASASESATRGARLDTSFLVDDPHGLMRWTVGDAITGGLSWSQPLRFAGFQVATDYSLRPDLVTVPLPRYFGDSAVPAAVDVFVGAAKVFETEIDPGPFELTNLPVVTGGGSATVVVYDVLGRETTQTLSLFTTDGMLAPGLDQFSFEAGFLRRGYGTEDFDYGAPLASGTWRRGLSDILTVEAHGEFARPVQTAGGGLLLGLEPYAVLGADVAASDHDGHDGTLADVSLTGRYGRIDFFGEYRTASRGYADLTVLDSAPQERRRLQIGASMSFDQYGSLSVASIDRSLAGEAPSRLVTASYSLDFGKRFLTLNGFYDRVTGNWYAGFSFNLLFGPRDVASVSGDMSNGAGTLSASYAHDADPDGGFGYRAAASAGQNAGLDLQGSWYGDDAAADAELSERRDQVGLRGDINGALVAMAGDVFATRQSDQAVALVHAGAPGVRIYKENRAVAISDANGDALVPGLVPFAANRISVDADDYPLSTVIEDSERIVVPERFAAAVVDMAPKARAPVLMTVRLDDGAVVPLGSRAHVAGNAEIYAVGRNGKLFLDDFPRAAVIDIALAAGTCRFALTPPPKNLQRIPDAGTQVCHGT